MWASDDSVSETESEAKPHAKRRRANKPVNTNRKSNTRARVTFKRESSDGESSSDDESRSEDSNNQENGGDQTERIDGLLYSLYHRYRQAFIVQSFQDGVSKKQDERHDPPTEGSQSGQHENLGVAGAGAGAGSVAIGRVGEREWDADSNSGSFEASFADFSDAENEDEDRLGTLQLSAAEEHRVLPSATISDILIGDVRNGHAIQLESDKIPLIEEHMEQDIEVFRAGDMQHGNGYERGGCTFPLV